MPTTGQISDYSSSTDASWAPHSTQGRSSPRLLLEPWSPSGERSPSPTPLHPDQLNDIYHMFREAIRDRAEPRPAIIQGLNFETPEEAVGSSLRNIATSYVLARAQRWQAYFEMGRAMDRFLKEEFERGRVDATTVTATEGLALEDWEAVTADRIFSIFKGYDDALWHIRHMEPEELGRMDDISYNILYRRMDWLKDDIINY